MKRWEYIKHQIGIKVNKGNFTATLIRFNQNLNYEKIYVFRIANVMLVFVPSKYICNKIRISHILNINCFYMEKKENGADLKSAAEKDEKKLFIETYGCQMNVADSEVVASVMQMAGYEMTDDIQDADAILSIRVLSVTMRSRKYWGVCSFSSL